MNNLQFKKKQDDYWAENTENHNNYHYNKIYRGIKFRLQDPILDIGGGSGTFLKYLKINKATIVDLSGGKNLVNPNYCFIKKDISKALKLNQKFKTIFVMETLEHLLNPLYLMAQIYDLLNDNGVCYVGVPYTKLDLQRDDGLNSHVSRWKDKEIKNQLMKLGFNVNFIRKRKRFMNTAFWFPHCFLLLELTK